MPFFSVLLAIAALPQFAPIFWERRAPFVLGSLTLLAGFFLTCQEGWQAFIAIGHVIYFEYLPFVMMLSALYVVAGGIKLRIHVRPTPFANTLYIAILTALAGILGTTGAAVLGIHGLLILNQKRQYQAHTILFFIFLVCNIGGGFSSIGDPPLFLGFLKGVDFLWPTRMLWKPVLFLSMLLLGLYACIDYIFFLKEPKDNDKKTVGSKIKVEGKSQFVLLIFVLATMVFTPFLGLPILYQETLKSSILLAIMAISFWITPGAWRKEHRWHWGPLKEVIMIFAALFITAHAPIKLLSCGSSGPFANFLNLLCSETGQLSSAAYFWSTGFFSALLDNAPTYAVFLATTQTPIHTLMTTKADILQAISLGAVFMGGLTYVGNAPNLLVKAVAEEEYQVKIPGFFMYTFWASIILLPAFWITRSLFS